MIYSTFLIIKPKPQGRLKATSKINTTGTSCSVKVAQVPTKNSGLHVYNKEKNDKQIYLK